MRRGVEAVIAFVEKSWKWEKETKTLYVYHLAVQEGGLYDGNIWGNFFPKISEINKNCSHIQLLSLLFFTPHLEGSVCEPVSCPVAPPQRMCHLSSHELILALRLALGRRSLGPFEHPSVVLTSSWAGPLGFWSHVAPDSHICSWSLENTKKGTTLSPLARSHPLTLKEIKKNLLVYCTLTHQSPQKKIFEFLPSVFFSCSLCFSTRRKVELTFHVNTKGLRLCALLIKVFSGSLSRYVLYILFFPGPLSAFLQHYYSSAQLMLLSKI